MIRDEISDQLVYSTVRIVCTRKGVVSLGTGYEGYKNFGNI